MRRADWEAYERREAMTRIRLIVWVVGIAALAIWWLVTNVRS
ncbi:MAG TPA: hypothetical protein VJU16_05150 [Planctomycetota bacterium]|nr:hypothetical protein [Planctomycetota bacterium]